MVRTFGALLAGLLLAQAGPARAADEAPAGSWKMTLPFQGASWLVKLESKGGKWTGTAAADMKTPEAKVENIAVGDGVLKFDLHVEQQDLTLPFEAAIPKEGDLIRGSVTLQGKAFPAEMQKTALDTFDPYELLKDDLAKQANTAEGVKTCLELLSQAGEKKAKADDARSWADKAVKWAEPYGERWHREILISVSEILGDQEGLGTVALQYARQAERGLDTKKDSGAVQRRVLKALAAALKASDKKDEAKDVEARLEKIPVVTAPPYPGRKGQSDRATLVELFTGAECPPCVTADTAFDALTKTFKPSEVVFLEYHLNIPGPDPMTNKDTEARQRYYGNKVRGTPTMFVDGKLGPAPGGRGEGDAQEKYDAYSALIQPLLEKPAKAKIKATTKFADGKSHVKIEVSDLAETGDDVRLRLALVEPRVAYTGGNKVAEHHDVVRGFVGDGGAEGMALKDKTGRQVVAVDPAEVKKAVDDYLKDAADSRVKYTGNPPTLDPKNLRLVAFIQNDDTGEVFQAVEVELPTE
jgi:hypothetical protein